MSEHTKGPWVSTVFPAAAVMTALANQGARQVVVAAPAPDGYVDAENVRARVLCIAVCGEPDGDGESQANARLIAAAPDLLAACVEFVRKVECGEARSKRSYAQMKAAIAKTEPQ